MSIWDQNAMDVRQRLLWIHGGKTLEKAFFFFCMVTRLDQHSHFNL